MRLLRRILGAIALGIGTIFGHKRDQETHWSEPPNWMADTDADETGSGNA